MHFRSGDWRLTSIGLVVACACQVVAGQSNQEWIAYKQKCGIPQSMAYNDWVAAGSHCNSGSAAAGTGSAEQLGTALGNIAGNMIVQGVHNLLRPAPARLRAPGNLAEDQRTLAARQLNNSGIYLLNRHPRDFAGAINEFQKALQQTPNDAVIAGNLQYARRLQKDSATAGQTSNMLGNLLGNNPSHFNASDNPALAGIPPNVFNVTNLDPNVVDFRGMFHNSLPQTGYSYLPAANANALNAILTGSDAGVVDLRGATKTSVDPKSVQTQIGGIFAKPVLAAEPPNPTVSRPPADSEKQTKMQIDSLFSKPDPPPHN